MKTFESPQGWVFSSPYKDQLPALLLSQKNILITHPPRPDQPPGLLMTLNVVYTETFQHVNAPLSQKQQPQQHHHQQQQVLEIKTSSLL